MYPLSVVDMGLCTSIQEAPDKLFDRRNVFTINLVGGVVMVFAGLNTDDSEDWIDVLGDSVPEDAGLPTFDAGEEEVSLTLSFFLSFFLSFLLFLAPPMLVSCR